MSPVWRVKLPLPEETPERVWDKAWALLEANIGRVEQLDRGRLLKVSSSDGSKAPDDVRLAVITVFAHIISTEFNAVEAAPARPRGFTFGQEHGRHNPVRAVDDLSLPVDVPDQLFDWAYERARELVEIHYYRPVTALRLGRMLQVTIRDTNNHPRDIGDPDGSLRAIASWLQREVDARSNASDEPEGIAASRRRRRSRDWGQWGSGASRAAAR